ncbi:MAG TPA: hypothetical protein DCX25_04360 [Candidatus Pacebacteria bacterium]|nr:MAG: hypothetical protein UX00_C0007G0032 [Microgenomates group bacterium GW2011_GWB1_45_17]KKU23546.1 MAG: hypothetical protein UX35_C0005G0048 [Microgenomates group bacterium GW2011_GWA1_46_15]KKU24431.1 MAG: hypothetical protein UX36_C0001G0048 [Microgenomates group bacterium GW2011_GWC1_46_15]HAV15536.1 hypothetical protein [Candidatus Paceibacterota bacterium]HCR10861.1 hypothetical protein [Candidatus Paceibacterota bacterium]
MPNSEGVKIYVSMRGLLDNDVQRVLTFLAPDESQRIMHLVGGEDGYTYELVSGEGETETDLQRAVEDCLNRFSGVSYTFIAKLVQEFAF